MQAQSEGIYDAAEVIYLDEGGEIVRL